MDSVLTLQEQQVLKGDILSWTDPVMVEWRTGPDPYSALDWYNTVETPEWIIWKNRITRDEIANVITYAGAGGLIARSQGEQFVFNFITQLSTINPSLVNIRNAFGDIFSGTAQAAVDTRNALISVSKRPSTRLEKLFSTGAGTTASPATCTMFKSLSPERDMRPLMI